jgi:hypothetical protein
VKVNVFMNLLQAGFWQAYVISRFQLVLEPESFSFFINQLFKKMVKRVTNHLPIFRTLIMIAIQNIVAAIGMISKANKISITD